ncbi:hypothetical protein B0H14DRAFT_2569952 [Mycena olivaceomarginata]|nr:hypothetical protein B0H14DRAFT_2569952 [Mycena olivaceomarginata]
MALALRCPTGAPEVLEKLFNNGLAVLDGIRGADEKAEIEKGKTFEVTEWVSCSRDGMVLLARLHQTYDVPDNKGTSLTPRKRIIKVDTAPGSSQQATDEMTDAAPVAEDPTERKVGDKYPTSDLPDHAGRFFNHQSAELTQRPYFNIDGSLIAPSELYSTLTEGTLVLVNLTAVTYVMTGMTLDSGKPIPDKKVYHVLVDKLRVLDHGNGESWDPAIPAMPERRFYAPAASPQRRPRDDAADAAFNNFGMKTQPSPPKKAKRTRGVA